jgi:hypothetical protein
MNAVHAESRPDWALERDAFGKLVLTDVAGRQHVGVVPVRAFPIQSPEDRISLVNFDGEEVVWIDSLAAREFMPAIILIASISSFSTPFTWTVETDRAGRNLSCAAMKTFAASVKTSPC